MNGNMQRVEGCRVSFCMSSQVWSAQTITDRLGIVPSEAHEIGEPLSKRHPQGKRRDMN